VGMLAVARRRLEVSKKPLLPLIFALSDPAEIGNCHHFFLYLCLPRRSKFLSLTSVIEVRCRLYLKPSHRCSGAALEQADDDPTVLAGRPHPRRATGDKNR
jgi:hypothetical protein